MNFKTDINMLSFFLFETERTFDNHYDGKTKTKPYCCFVILYCFVETVVFTFVYFISVKCAHNDVTVIFDKCL